MQLVGPELAWAIGNLRPSSLAGFCLNFFRVPRQELKTESGTFWLDPASHPAKELRREGVYDKMMSGILKAAAKPGTVAVDIGANEGILTTLLSKAVGSHGRVIAVEPQSRLQRVIAKNLELNSCKNVVVSHRAITNGEGVISLPLARRCNTGATSLYGSSKRTEQVYTLSLQQLFSLHNIEQCSVLKIDAEGAEYDILEAAMDLLFSRRIETLAVDLHDEILWKQKRSTGPIHHWLTKAGYDLIRGSDPALYTLDRGLKTRL